MVDTSRLPDSVSIGRTIDKLDPLALAAKIETVATEVFASVRAALDAHPLMLKLPARHYVGKVNAHVRDETNFSPFSMEMGAVLHEVFLRIRQILATGHHLSPNSNLQFAFPDSSADIDATADILESRLETIFRMAPPIRAKARELSSGFEETLSAHEIIPGDNITAYILQSVWLKISAYLGNQNVS